MISLRAFECVCEKQFSNDNAPLRLCRGSKSLFGILGHPIYPSLAIWRSLAIRHTAHVQVHTSFVGSELTLLNRPRFVFDPAPLTR